MQYCERFSRYAAAHDVVATLHHEPGKAAGNPARLMDPPKFNRAVTPLECCRFGW